MKNIFLFLIRFYRRFVSPLFPPSCRFVPTCSEYAMEAFQRKSVLRALWLTVVRVMKCNPWHPGGYDPVK
ncbi:MAG TPA: membrane protein insertion efficiency factor YidD [Nitrospirota bacterium]|nr:membrane protein insertion efficiency factor YidD [Nitrospirota bacterium]